MGKITPIVELPIPEQEDGEAALVAAYGGPAPLAIARRLARDESAGWVLSYRTCVWSARDFDQRVLGENLGDYKAATAFDPARHSYAGLEIVGRSIETRHAPLTEALALIADPNGPEAFPRRFDQLVAGHKAWAEVSEAKGRAEIERRREQALQEEKLRGEFRAEDWSNLHPGAQALYLTAALVDGGKSIADALRTVAASANNANPRYPWPKRKWW